LEYETLSAEDVNALLEGREIHRPDADESPPDTGVTSTVPASGSGKQSPGGLEPEPQPGS
jgi:hypothetical protein